MVYLAQSAPTGGRQPAERIVQLVQAVPGLVAVRDRGLPDVTAPLGRPLTPPVQPPTDGWRVRQPGAAGPPAAPGDAGTLDAVLVLLLVGAAEQADSAQLLADSEARWLRADRVAGHEVDVLLGPAIPPAVPATESDAAPLADRSLAGMGGAVQYWLDRQGRLHRMEALLTEQVSLRIDLDRDDRTAPPVLAALGGARIDPRPVTEAEAEALAALAIRNIETAGGEITIRINPGPDDAPVRANGWLDWYNRLAYLATYRDSVPDRLLLADGVGVATRSDLPPRAGMPPLPPPAGDRWQWTPWQERGDEQGGYELDVLLNEMLSLGAWQSGDLDRIKREARWLREDTVGGAAVDVFEVPRPTELDLPPGQARLRYWVSERTGVLLRLEVRGRSGGFSQLDFTPTTVPVLG
jgi:hypothetical protein